MAGDKTRRGVFLAAVFGESSHVIEVRLLLLCWSWQLDEWCCKYSAVDPVAVTEYTSLKGRQAKKLRS